MRKFKCSFVKFRKGQSYFERSITIESMNMLLIMCDDVKIKYKKNKNTITFIFHKKEQNVYCAVNRVPDYIAKTFLPMEEWTE